MLSRALQRQREMAAVDDETGWAVAIRRSVILSGKKDGKPFVREDFTDSLNEILTCLKDHVAALLPLAGLGTLRRALAAGLGLGQR